MDSPDPARRQGGCLRRFLMLFLLGCAVGLGFAIHAIAQPQDMSDLADGRPAAGQPTPRDLRTVLEQSVQRGHTLRLTEAEINAWLEKSLKLHQGGLLRDAATLDAVRVRLAEDHAEVILVRTIAGKPFTISMFLGIEQTEDAKGLNTRLNLHGGPFHPSLPFLNRGGRFGRLVVPQGFLILVLPSFRSLADCFPEEIRLGFREMERIRFEEDRLHLEPIAPHRDLPILPGTF